MTSQEQNKNINLNDLEIAFLTIERDTAQYKIGRIDELLNIVGQKQAAQDQPSKSAKIASAVNELNFITLKFEGQQGAKLGDYEVAYKQNNLPEKWQAAFNILNLNNATISSRYHGESYQYSYWIYGENKIYRQKLKEKQ
jgi:hypothetical protein